MSKTNLLLGAILVIGVVWLGATQHRTGRQLEHENAALREQLAQTSRLTADNQRLSNLVAQARIAQIAANQQLEELMKLRSEVTRLTQANQQSNLLAQASMADSLREQVQQLTALRHEISGLTEEIGGLRDDLLEFGSAAATPAVETPAQPTAQAPARNAPDRTISLRIIETHLGFAEKLKRSVGAREDESFADVFGRFLQTNGIDTEPIVGLVFDERTGRVIVRAPRSQLDAIEKVTVALDAAQ